MMFMADWKSGKIGEWDTSGDCWTSTSSPGSVRRPRSKGYLATPRLVLSSWSGVKKNGLRAVRYGVSELLRQQDAACPGPCLWGCANLFGSGGAAGLLPAVREGEAGAAGLAVRQPLLHEAVCVVCRATVPFHEYQGRGQGRASGLAYGKAIREAIHGGATPAYRASSSASDRDRRDLPAEGAYVPDHRQRLRTAAPPLVWRPRPVCGELGLILCMVGGQEGSRDPASGDGHVEGF